MEYYLIRKKFCELSGRYDLMNADYTDNGADFFFEAGQRFLDMLQDTKKMQAKNIQQVSAGTTIVKITGLRSIIEVMAGNTTDGLIRLSKASMSQLKEYYEKQLSSVDQGTPIYYAPTSFRPYADNTAALTWASFYDSTDLVLGDTHYTYEGIIIMPPPDSTYYVSIYGLFYSPTLSATLAGGTWTQTKSVWSEVWPSLLIQAALYQLEVFYRNTEGAKDWRAAITETIGQMDIDSAHGESIDINQMQG
jgi:hypothetical protein